MIKLTLRDEKPPEPGFEDEIELWLEKRDGGDVVLLANGPLEGRHGNFQGVNVLCCVTKDGRLVSYEHSVSCLLQMQKGEVV